MTQPYINQNGDLIIPNGADPKFQWWNETNPGRMSLTEILESLDASPEIQARYLGAKEVVDAEVVAPPTKKKKGAQ